jgi:hypothetical protein
MAEWPEGTTGAAGVAAFSTAAAAAAVFPGASAAIATVATKVQSDADSNMIFFIQSPFLDLPTSYF